MLNNTIQQSHGNSTTDPWRKPNPSSIAGESTATEELRGYTANEISPDISLGLLSLNLNFDYWRGYAESMFRAYKPEHGLPYAPWLRNGWHNATRSFSILRIPKKKVGLRDPDRGSKVVCRSIYNDLTLPQESQPSHLHDMDMDGIALQLQSRSNDLTRSLCKQRYIDVNGMVSWLSNYHEDIIDTLAKEYGDRYLCDITDPETGKIEKEWRMKFRPDSTNKSTGGGFVERPTKLFSMIATHISEIYPLKADSSVLTIDDLDGNPDQIKDWLLMGTRALLEEATKDVNWRICKKPLIWPLPKSVKKGSGSSSRSNQDNKITKRSITRRGSSKSSTEKYIALAPNPPQSQRIECRAFVSSWLCR